MKIRFLFAGLLATANFFFGSDIVKEAGKLVELFNQGRQMCLLLDDNHMYVSTCFEVDECRSPAEDLLISSSTDLSAVPADVCEKWKDLIELLVTNHVVEIQLKDGHLFLSKKERENAFPEGLRADIVDVLRFTDSESSLDTFLWCFVRFLMGEEFVRSLETDVQTARKGQAIQKSCDDLFIRMQKLSKDISSTREIIQAKLDLSEKSRAGVASGEKRLEDALSIYDKK